MKVDESSLRELLDRATRASAPSPSFESRTIQRARRSVRIRQVSAAVASVVAVAVAVSVSTLAPPWSRQDPSDVATKPASPSAEAQTPVEWVQSLKVGDTSTVPFVVNRALHAGGSIFPLDAKDAGFVGTSIEGWVVSVETQTGNGGVEGGLIVVSMDGDVTPLPSSEYQLQNSAVSPDGRLIAYGTSVFDLETWKATVPLPAKATVLLGWTVAGLVYMTASGDTWVWQPGETPHATERPLVSVATSEAIQGRGAAEAVAVTQESDNCSSVVELASSGETEELNSACGDQRPIEIAPDGATFLTADLGVGSVGQSEVRSPPNGFPASSVVPTSVGWDTDGSVLYPIEGPPTGIEQPLGKTGSKVGYVVRCAVSTLECERAGGAIDVPTSDYLDLDPRVE